MIQLIKLSMLVGLSLKQRMPAVVCVSDGQAAYSGKLRPGIPKASIHRHAGAKTFGHVFPACFRLVLASIRLALAPFCSAHSKHSCSQSISLLICTSLPAAQRRIAFMPCWPTHLCCGEGARFDGFDEPCQRPKTQGSTPAEAQPRSGKQRVHQIPGLRALLKCSWWLGSCTPVCETWLAYRLDKPSFPYA